MKIANTVGFAGSVILTVSLSAWMPVVGPLFSLIIPLPFLFYFCKLDIKEGLIDCAIALSLVELLGRLTGQSYLSLFCLEFGIMGFVVALLYRRNLSIGATIFWGTSSMLIMASVFLLFMGITRGQGPFDMILGYIQENLAKTVEIYRQSGLEQEKVDQIKQAFDLLSKVIARIYPSLIIAGTGLIVWMNVILSRPLFRAGGLSYPDFGDVTRWHTPEFMVWGVIVAGFALFLQATGIRFIAENLLVVLGVTYLFHGLSIMSFFFEKYRMPNWARTVMYFLVFIQQIFLILLALAGLFDQWVDFRKIHKKIDPEATT